MGKVVSKKVEEEVVETTPEVSEVQRLPSIQSLLAELSDDPERKAQAYGLYVSTNKTPEEIGLSLSLPGFLIRHWIAAEKWTDMKARAMAQAFKRADLQYAELIREHRVSEAERQLEGAQLLEEEVIDLLRRMEAARAERDQDEPAPRNHDMTLVRLSQALKNATDISSRVVGISEVPPLSEAEAAKTIIMIGGRPAQSIRLSDSSDVIDIEEEGEEE